MIKVGFPFFLIVHLMGDDQDPGKTEESEKPK